MTSLRSLFLGALLPALLAAAPAFARIGHHAPPVLPRAAVAPDGVLLSPGDNWREVADAPASPALGPTPATGVLGGAFPGLGAHDLPREHGVPYVPDTGKLDASLPLGPQGPTGGIIPSAQPGWRPAEGGK